VMCGADERTWRAAQQRSMAVRLGAPFTPIPAAGHSVNVEQPELLVCSLLEFWARVEAEGARIASLD
jgi:pimeloyl-ACP methyl ester carboxylesterase